MDLKTIKNLLNLISDSDVNEVEIEEGDFKIKVKKQPDTITRGDSSPVYMGNPAGAEYRIPAGPAPQAPQPPSEATPSSQSPNPGAGGESSADDKLITVRSPIVGTFYRSPSPESDSFINIGDTVAKGDVLCIIEAMKIMNEIESEYAGKVVKALVDDAQPVEYDQPLFLIDPS